MSKEVVFYGEKGILNSIILDTQGDIAKQKQFLRSIVLADKSKLDWVDDVCLFRYFVEPCFDQFGSPDMIVEAKTKDNDKYILFIEADLNSYEYSALKMEPLGDMNNEYLPKSYKNNCNKINVQLAILYRFIQAYNNLSDCENLITTISEKNDAKSTYNDDIGRKLENRIILDYWYENFRDAKGYYFIALTNDSKEVLEDKYLNSDLFPYNNNNIMPPIGSEQWDKDKNKFGITTYETLINKKVISKNAGYYKDTSELMLINPPTISAYKKEKESNTLITINMEKWSENQHILYNLLKDTNMPESDFKSLFKEFVEAMEYD